jgi:hypothetical protein
MFGQPLPIFQKPLVLRREQSGAIEAQAHDDLAARHFSAEMSAFEPQSTSIGEAFL